MMALMLAAAMTVGTTSSMTAAFPRRGESVEPAESCGVRLARNEKESFQVLVSSASGDLKGVRVSVGALMSPTAKFDADNVDCDVVGYVDAKFVKSKRFTDDSISTAVTVPTNTPVGYIRKAVLAKDGWYPDPILDFLDAVDVAKGDVQAFWIRVRCPENHPAGVYRSTLTVSVREPAMERTLPFTVRVNGFAVPKVSPLPLAVTWAPMAKGRDDSPEEKAAEAALAADSEGPIALANARQMEWAEFLADYYITFDSLYTKTNLNWEVLTRLRDTGRLGLFNLGYWAPIAGTNAADEVKWREETLGRLRRNYDRAKELGILDRAYVYGSDELPAEKFEAMRRSVKILRDELPGVPISTTATDGQYGVGTPLDCIDWFTPITSDFDPVRAVRSRARGHQVWWYFCLWPGSPWPNAFIQCPPLDLRLFMGAQSVRMRPDGFLYYELTVWNSKRPITSGPFTDWSARSWVTLNGDGCWTAVGPGGRPLPTQRLENFRDGLEDYAYAMELERRLAAHPHGAWAAKAKALLAVPVCVMDTMTNFTGDPREVLAWRDDMADLIDADGEK